MSQQMFDADFAAEQRDTRGKDTVIPRFSTEAVVDNKKTRETGTVVMVDKEFVTLMTPGNNMERVHRPVKKFDREVRFKRFYDVWKSGQEMKPEGFPIVHWALIKPSEAAMLERARVFTIEQLANMPEDALPKHMPQGVALQIKARKFLEARSDNAKVSILMTKLDDLQAQAVAKDSAMADLKAQVQALTARVAPLNPVQQQGPPLNPPKPVPEVHLK